jgi:hypothetical protein
VLKPYAISDEKIATIVAGQRPSDLAPDEAVAYDVASALVSQGALAELNYRHAVKIPFTARRNLFTWLDSIASYR